MAPPTTTLWDPDPHTGAKHQMLRGYLEAWFPIVAQGFPSSVGLTYIDAFAGPGEYKDGGVGSPVIALEQALRQEVWSNCSQVRVLLVEKDQARFNHLRDLVDRQFVRRPSNLVLRVINGPCEAYVVPELSKMGGPTDPLFANFDGWGTDTPYSLVRAVAVRRSAEVLVTFKSQHFIRFAKLEDQREGDLVFGSQEWRDIAKTGTPAEKKKGLVDLYRGRLADVGFSYALIFELVDEGGRELLLVFATKDLKGVVKMKESMWRVDPSHGQRFRDPRDVNQLAMDFGVGPNLTLLGQQLLARLEDGPQSLHALKQYALTDTVFKPTHAPQAIELLKESGAIEVGPGRTHADKIVTLADPKLF
jgi:three-Cys-motif partner protein